MDLGGGKGLAIGSRPADGGVHLARIEEELFDGGTHLALLARLQAQTRVHHQRGVQQEGVLVVPEAFQGGLALATCRVHR